MSVAAFNRKKRPKTVTPPIAPRCTCSQECLCFLQQKPLDKANLATPRAVAYRTKAPDGTLTDGEVRKLCHDHRVRARMKELASGSGE